jgi:hypothetical protein
MRATLDNLAFQLAIAHIGWPLSDEVSRRSEFPIFEDPAEFARRRKGKIGATHPDAQAVIESLQPYHGGDPASGTEQRLRHLLRRIHALEIQDKHRSPHLLWQTFAGMSTSMFDHSNIADWRLNFGPLEENAVVSELVFRSSNPGVEVNPYTWADVGFEPLPGLAVNDALSAQSTLNNSLDDMDVLVAMFERFF